MPKSQSIPSKYLCAITGQIMIDPVMAADGHTYEREAIEEWLKTHDTSPRTNEKLEDKKLRTNHDKRGDILDFLDSHSELYEEDEIYLPKSWVQQCVIAIKGNELSEVQRLLDRDRRLLTIKLEEDRTALELACDFSSPELVDMLLKRFEQKNQLPILDGLALKPRHLNVLFVQALENEDYHKCELLLKLGAEIEQQEEITQNTVLHRMAIQGRVEPIRWLLEQKAVLESRNIEGNTPLLLSVLHNHESLTEFLLSVHANPRLKNKEAQSAISLVVLEEKPAMLAFLVGSEKAVLPPLHLGLALNDNALLKALLEKKIDSLEALDEKQRTPFYSAVEIGNLEAVKLLVEAGVNPTVKNEITEFNALHIAVSRRDEAMLQYLLKTRAVDLIDAQNAEGDTPLHLAVQSRDENIILLLLKAGAYPKIKNAEDQTSLELAKIQTPRLANFIMQGVRALKKSKLKESEKLHQVVAEQSSEILHLRDALAAQLSKIEKLEKQLQGVVLPASSPAALTFSQQASPRLVLIHTNAPAVPNVNRKEVEELLKLVAEGEQDKAEAMLKKNPALALTPTDVTDLSKRTFKNITALQYALWALDWQMWTMLLKYIPQKEASEQIAQSEQGLWIPQHGMTANWDNLIQALNQYVSEVQSNKPLSVYRQTWVKQVGGAQLLLPAHVINEYCHPSRPFDPVPDFTKPDPAGAWRSRTTDEGEWFSAKYGGGTLGEGFAVCRGSNSRARAYDYVYTTTMIHLACLVWGVAERDSAAVSALFKTRASQRAAVVAQYLPKQEPVRKIAKA